MFNLINLIQKKTFSGELPKFLQKAGNTIFDIGKSVFQGITRSGASVGLSLTQPFTKKDILKDEDLDPDVKWAKNVIFGPEPLKSISRRIEEGQEKVEQFSEKKGLTLGPGGAEALSTIGVLGVIALDFTGGGGKKEVAKVLSKTTKIDDVARILKQINVAEDLISPYAKAISKLNKVDDVVRAIDKISDIQKTTRPLTKTGEKLIPELTRQRGFLETVAKARPDVPLRVGGQYVPRSTDKLAIKAKDLILKNIDEAEKLARTGLGISGKQDDAVATAAELIKFYDDSAFSATDKAIKNAFYDKSADIAHVAAAELTELGRGIQAATLMARQTPEGMVRFIAKEINRYNEAVTKSSAFGRKVIPNLTGEQVKIITDGMRKVTAMADGTEKAIAFKKLSDSLLSIIPSSLMDKVTSVWRAGLLTGIKTSGLNTASNLSHGFSEAVKDVPAYAVDNMLSLFTKKHTIGTPLRGGVSSAKGTVEGVNKGWKFLKTGYDDRNVLSKFDYKKVNFGKSKVAKSIQAYEETIFKMMGAEDQPFYYAAKARSIANQASASARNNKLTGSSAKKFVSDLVKSPTDEIIQTATKDAEIAVFQNPTLLGKMAKHLQNFPIVGKFVVPFSRTPASVATQFVNYSPVGIAKTIIQNIGKGRFDQRLFAQGIGRGLVGSGVFAIGGALAKKGMVSTSYPDNKKERELWELEGRKENTIKIGDKWRNVAVLGPAGFTVIAGAKYQEALKETGSQSKAVGQALIGGAESLKEQTFIQNLNQFVSALDDPERFVSGYFSGFAASTIPTIIGDAAKATDPLERRTESVVQRIKSRIPGLRQTLEPKVDVLGKEVTRQGNWFETMFDPSRPSEIVSTDVSQEIRRLTDAGHNVTPTALGTKEGYETLTQEQNTKLWEKNGEILNEKLKNLFASKQYKELGDEEKAKYIDSFTNISKTLTRAMAALELVDGLNGQELRDKISELKADGLLTFDAFKIFVENLPSQ